MAIISILIGIWSLIGVIAYLSWVKHQTALSNFEKGWFSVFWPILLVLYSIPKDKEK